MKTRNYILAAAIFAATMINPGKAKAHISHTPPPPPPPPPVCPSKGLPIDGNIAFLMIAGTAIGIVTVKKSNSSLKAAPVKA